MKTRTHIPDHVRRIHCVGIGGSGMFPLVQILHTQGYCITGSDNNEGDIVDAQRKMGIRVDIGHDAAHVAGADLVLYSAAIPATNPELAAAREAGIPLWGRAAMLGAVSSWYEEAVGISGTHGKTTVTSMLTQILYGAGRDPSAVIGGKLPAIGGYGRAGASDLFVYEACEFKDTFLETHPDFAVVLNIDNDHMDYFGTIDNAMNSYTAFMQKAGRILYNGDDHRVVAAADRVPHGEKHTFGWGNQNEFYPAGVVMLDGLHRTFDLMHRGEKLVTIALQVPGEHNILNAAAAAAAAYLLGVAPEDIARHLAAFGGAGRRFEVLGRVGGVTIADDYAHHPAELEVTLRAAKELKFRQVWAIFQPFTFSRTYLLLEDFAAALSLGDRVVLSPIMGGRETNSYQIHTSDLGEKIPGSVWLDSFQEIADYVMAHAQPGDLVLTLGCGDIYKCARMMMQKGDPPPK